MINPNETVKNFEEQDKIISGLRKQNLELVAQVGELRKALEGARSFIQSFSNTRCFCNEGLEVGKSPFPKGEHSKNCVVGMVKYAVEKLDKQLSLPTPSPRILAEYVKPLVDALIEYRLRLSDCNCRNLKPMDECRGDCGNTLNYKAVDELIKQFSKSAEGICPEK